MLHSRYLADFELLAASHIVEPMNIAGYRSVAAKLIVGSSIFALVDHGEFLLGKDCSLPAFSRGLGPRALCGISSLQG